MAGDVRVIEDGIERGAGPRPRQTPWAWLLIGFFVGVGFGVVFLSPTAQTGVTVPLTGSPENPDIPDVPDDPVGISQVVEGFPDALVVIAETEARSLEHLIWPTLGDVVSRPLPAGDFGPVSLDESGTWIATTLFTPGQQGLHLSMGKPSAVLPLDSDVTSFRWHDSRAGFLSYTRVVDGTWHLYRVTPNRQPELVLSEKSGEGVIAAWGDWGWAIQDPASVRVTLYTNSGEFRTSLEGVAHDSHPDGWILVGDENLMMVSSGGGVRMVEIPVDGVTGSELYGSLMTGSISPDGNKLALLGTQGLVVVSVGGFSEPVYFGTAFGSPQVAWSSDSRFVIVPGFRGVFIGEVETGTEQVVLAREMVQAAQVIPLSGGT